MNEAKKKFEIDFLDEYTEEKILKELKRISKVTGKQTLRQQDIHEFGRVAYVTIHKKFGTLRNALEKAGLKAKTFTKPNKKELCSILIQLWEITLEKEGHRPERSDLKKYGFPVSADTVYRMFGGWKKALIEAYDSVKDDKSLDEPEILPTKKVAVKRKDISLRKRFFVLKRDEFTCVLCGASGRGVKLEVDHRVPVSKDGGNDLDNLYTACFKCNRGKRDSLLS